LQAIDSQCRSLARHACGYGDFGAIDVVPFLVMLAIRSFWRELLAPAKCVGFRGKCKKLILNEIAIKSCCTLQFNGRKFVRLAESSWWIIQNK
jgi:hypothetical protein